MSALAGEGGDVDAAAVATAVDQLAKDKPYLAVETTGSASWGDVGAGPRASAEPEPATPFDRLRRAHGDSWQNRSTTHFRGRTHSGAVPFFMPKTREKH